MCFFFGDRSVLNLVGQRLSRVSLPAFLFFTAGNMFALTFQRFAWKTFVQELLDIYYIHPHFSDGLYGLFIVLILFKECHSRPKD